MIMGSHNLPFKVGQEAEAKSFAIGFRSAWFRCKIKDMIMQKGQLGYSMEFFDFPDEKITWTKLYEKPPQHSKSPGDRLLELMVRPPFPPYYRESDRPDSYPASDVVVIVEDEWEVGDLVDWWSDGCFWSGRVIQLLGNNKLKIELPEPPIGEGVTYDADYKDLRPSLEWSAEYGWTVPISRERGSLPYCARLVQPLVQDEETVGGSFEENVTDRNDIHIRSQLDNIMKIHDSNEPSSSHDKRRLSNVLSRKKRYGSSDLQEKVISMESKYNSLRRHSDTVESAIMELEELANKIKWLKGLLRSGFQWPNVVKPSWKILENCGPYMEN